MSMEKNKKRFWDHKWCNFLPPPNASNCVFDSDLPVSPQIEAQINEAIKCHDENHIPPSSLKYSPNEELQIAHRNTIIRQMISDLLKHDNCCERSKYTGESFLLDCSHMAVLK